MKKFNTYTNEDVWELISIAKSMRDWAIVAWFAKREFTQWGDSLQIYVSIVRKIEKRVCKGLGAHYDDDLYKFVYNTIYEDIPLYLNSDNVPKLFIKWRLKIGK